MSPEEARKTKRKWRKLMRKAKKRSGWYGEDKGYTKRSARFALSEKGRELFEEKSK